MTAWELFLLLLLWKCWPLGRMCALTWMGEYHFRFCGSFLCVFFGFGSNGSYSCSGIFTTAFFGFSSLAPSSVEPFPPQRTCTPHNTTQRSVTQTKVEDVSVVSIGGVLLLPCVSHLHPLDSSNSSSSIIRRIHSGPLFLRQSLFIVRLLKNRIDTHIQITGYWFRYFIFKISSSGTAVLKITAKSTD